MTVFCVDIGNTHTHFGRVSGAGVDELASMPSELLKSTNHPIVELLRCSVEADGHIDGVAFCSVVPELTTALRAQVSGLRSDLPLFQLTHEVDLGFPLTHPRPAQIGQDRLANAVAAHALCGSPTIIVDSGTAVTSDVITPVGGFEGGIIAPGIGLMREALHEKTAQLPRIEDDPDLRTAIGKSTVEAMQIGCTIGFRGMVASLVSAQRKELANRGLPEVSLVMTGGSAHLLAHLDPSGSGLVPDLTLRGLHQAFLLNAPKGNPTMSDMKKSESD